MDIRQMEYYVEICKAGSLSRAANKLYISQQALGKSMDLLEEEVGVPLLLRTCQGIKLTKYGESMYIKALEFMDQYSSLESFVKNLQGTFSKSFSIGFYNGLWEQIGYECIEEFIDTHPNLDIHLYSYQDSFQGRSGFNKDVDILFATSEVYNPLLKEYYHSRHKLDVLISKNNPLSTKDEITIDDLRNEYMIGTNAEYEAQHKLAVLLSDNNITPSSILGDIENELSNYMVHKHNAITFYAGPDTTIPANMVRRSIKDINLDWDFYIYVRKSNVEDYVEELANTIIDIRKTYAIKS